MAGYLEASIKPPALDGEGERRAPFSNLLAEIIELGVVVASNLGLEVLELVGFLGKRGLDLLAELDGLVNVLGNALEIGLVEATAGHGRGTNTETAGGKGALVSGDGVLVASNVDALENGLDTGAVEVVLAEVDEDHVGVGAVGDELVAESLELVLKSLGVVYNLLLVGLEVGAGGLLQGNSEGGDGVVVGAALMAGEDGEVDGALEVVEGLLAGLGIGGADALAEEDHGTAGSTKRLVGGGGDNVGVLERRGDDASGDQARDVGHVDDEIGTDRVGNLAHASIVDQTAVGRGTGNKDLGAVEDRVLGKGIIVDDTGLEVNPVGHGLEVGRDSRDPVGEGEQC